MEFENNKDKTLKEIVISLCSKEIKDDIKRHLKSKFFHLKTKCFDLKWKN